MSKLSWYIGLIGFFMVALIIAHVVRFQNNHIANQPSPELEYTKTTSTSVSVTSSTNNQPSTSPTSSDSASTSSNSSDKSSQLDQTPPEEATYIEVIAGCDHKYDGACLNARSQPTTKSSVVTQLRNGQVLKVDSTVTAQDQLWYEVTFSGEWIRYPNRLPDTWYVAGEYVRPLTVEEKGTPEPNTASSSKQIIIDLSDQQLTAYQGDTVFMQEAVSTGRALYPTPRGRFPVFKMTPSRYMQGPIPNIADQYYDLPGVPWNLYFTYQGAVIHGAYWHNNFGKPWSHGCVNLPPGEAEKMYRWAELGTEVVVRD